MLKRLGERERAALLVSEWEPRVRAAFMAAIAEIKSKITLRFVVEAMERGDISGAIDAMNIDREAFGGLETAIADAFNAGGQAAAENMALRDPEGHRVVFRWAVRNPEAEAWLRGHSAELVTNIVAEQKTNIRDALASGLMRGDNPNRTALDIVGRVSRATGTRQGGIIGLSAPHLATTERARQALLSGDPEGMRAYLQLKRRDKRFDGAIHRAIETSKPISRADVDKVIGRLSDGYLKLRADTIALHETFTALGQSRNEAFRQAIAAGKVEARDVVKTWRHTTAEHPRMQHVAMAGQTVAFDQPFVAPDGTPIAYPHADGVPASHTLGCKCRCEYRIAFAERLARSRRH